MIRAFTGLPGHGKTLFVVAELMKERERDSSRPLYVRGIRGLKIDHAEFDGVSWTDLPDGSLLVIDEAQQVFPVRRSGETPAYIAALATHRHRGIDIWVITQHPSLLDSFIRKLIDRHTHLFRISGAEVAQVYQWNELQDDPRSMSAREVSESFVWKYPRDVFGAYDSAVMHTAKARVPKKLVYLAVMSVLIVVLIGWLFSWGDSRINPEGNVSPSSYTPVSAPIAQPNKVVIRSPEEWIKRFTPRIPHRPESAPAYDQMMATALPPRLYCVDVELAGCRCYTDQLTIWTGVPPATCQRLAREGVLHLQMANRR